MSATATAWWWAYRHQVRELRARAVLWIAGVSLVGAAFAVGWQRTYPTELSRRVSAAALEGVPVFEAVSGRTVALSTVEGFVLWRWGGFAALLVAAWALTSASAMIRIAEVEGRTELLRSRAIGPRALLATSLAALGTWFAVLALTVTVTHSLAGFDLVTAAVFGTALGALATVVAVSTALVAQILLSARGTNRIVGGAVVVAVLVRVVAAASWAPDWLWWATPFGWMTFLHESDDARLQVLGAFTVAALLLLPVALSLARRDLQTARFAGRRPGDRRILAPTSGRSDRVLLRFAHRLGSASAAGWLLAAVIVGIVVGVLADDFATAVAQIPEAAQLSEQVGWQIDSPAGVIGSLLLLMAPVLAFLGVGQIAAARDDEASTRLETLLVRRVGRIRWLTTRVAVAAVWIAFAAGASVLAAWAGAAITGVSLPVVDAVRTAMNLLPVAWMFLGLGVAAFGLVPRFVTALAPILILGAFVFDLIGGLFDLPEWVRRLGPFRYVEPVPGVEADVAAGLVMVAVAAAGTAIGLIAFRRRDLCGP